MENNKPITKKEDVAKSKDEKIDQDFNGYPHTPAKEGAINPKTEEDKVAANLKTNNYENADDQESVGSANAFEKTEGSDVLREELDKNKDEKKIDSNY